MAPGEIDHTATLTAAALQGLRARGQRVTPARRAVIEVLGATDEHLDAEEIGTRVGDRYPGIHRATVYRTLETLAQSGILVHVHTGRGPTTYHVGPGLTGEEHLHVQCRVCGRIADLPADLLDDVSSRVRAHGFVLEPDHVALSGTCLDCAGP